MRKVDNMHDETTHTHRTIERVTTGNAVVPWTQGLFTFAQRDEVFTGYGDAEFRSIAVVEGHEGLL